MGLGFDALGDGGREGSRGRDGRTNRADGCTIHIRERNGDGASRGRFRGAGLRRYAGLGGARSWGFARGGGGLSGSGGTDLLAGFNRDRTRVGGVDGGFDRTLHATDDEFTRVGSRSRVLHGVNGAADTSNAHGRLNDVRGLGVKFTDFADDLAASHDNLGNRGARFLIQLLVFAVDNEFRNNLTESAHFHQRLRIDDEGGTVGEN